MLAYLDTSAMVKLVVAEEETQVLVLTLGDADLVASAVVRTELRRAAGRHGNREITQRVERLLTAVNMVALSDLILDRAGKLSPTSMRSLDALHLASALSLADQLDFVVSYDVRLADAARSHGLEVTAPQPAG